jgi:type IV fimbrial biogenesis protein FimT
MRSGCRPFSLARRGAFSIMELVMVLAIIAVIGAIAIPRYGQSIANYRASSAAQRIVSDIALAQATARGTSSSISILFMLPPDNAKPSDPEIGGGYSINGIRDLERASDTYTVWLAAEPYLSVMTSLDSTNATAVTKSDGSVRLTFDGYGTGDGNVTVIIASGSVQRTVTFDAATGRCSIQ